MPPSFLVLSRFRPDHPAGGAALRNWQNIQALAQLGPVDVVTFGEEEAYSRDIPHVRQWFSLSLPQTRARRRWPERMRAKLWRYRPGVHPIVDGYRSQRLFQTLHHHLRHHRYSVAVVEELSLAGFIPLLKEQGCRVVFDAHNVESILRLELEALHRSRDSAFRRLKRRWRQQRLAGEEQRAVCLSDLVWACSHKDAEQLQQLYQPRAPVAVVPNGINPTDYENTQAVSARDDWSGHALTVSFLGSYSYLPNEDAALQLIREVMPALRSAAADPRLLLIGREPTPALRQAAAGDARITITGAVDSILPYLASPSVVTLPISCGSGTRLKILEAFAAGRPVVSTAKGAEGLEVVDGRHLLVRDHPADIAAAVLEVWRDPARRSQLVERSRQLVEDQYSWAACAAKIARSLEPVMSGVVHPVAAGVTAP